MKRAFILAVIALLAGCTGNSCNPPALLFPVLLPIAIPAAIVAKAREPSRRPVLRPVSGGDSVEQPFILRGQITKERLQWEEHFGYWSDQHFQIPGLAVRWSSALVEGKTIHAVVFRDWSSAKEVCYYFDVTDVHLVEKAPGKSP